VVPTSMTLNDIESRKIAGFVNFSRFEAAARISRLNCAQIFTHAVARLVSLARISCFTTGVAVL